MTRFQIGSEVVSAVVAVLGAIATAMTGPGCVLAVVKLVTALRREHAEVMALGRGLG